MKTTNGSKKSSARWGKTRQRPQGFSIWWKPSRNQEIDENAENAEIGRPKIPEGKILEIGYKKFLTQLNDIYFNIGDYADKTIVVEGMFTYLVSYLDEGLRTPAVYRRSPGCCGNDGWGGFMLDWNGKFPKDDEWIRVAGRAFIQENGGFEDLFLKVESLEVKKERGLEFVRD